MAREIEYVSKDVLIEWLRPYLHTGEPIPADVLISDIRMMSPTLTPPNEWVSVEEKLPEQDGSYLVVTGRGAITTARFYAARKFRDGYHRKYSWQANRSVTHWMPLPAPPDRRTLEGENA